MSTKIKQQEKQLAPILRFPEFAKPWVVLKLGGLFAEREELLGMQSKELLSVTTNAGIIKQSQCNKRDGSSLNKSKYKVVHKGDIVYNTMRMWQGAFGVSDYEGMVSPAYTVLSLNNGIIDFYKYLFKKPRSVFNFYRFSQGLTSDTWNLKYNNFSRVVVAVPGDALEQKKIADLFSVVDSYIDNLKSQKQVLEEYKKGVVQKIFSQEIRFKDENGEDFPEWEEKELGDCLDYEQPTKYIVSNTEYRQTNKIPVLTAGKTFVLGYTDEAEGIYDNPLPIILFDDFTTDSKLVDFPFKIKSSAAKILKVKEGVNIRFVFEAMELIPYEIGGHGRHWISKFSKIKIKLPTLLEQTKIANWIISLDSGIAIKQTEIDNVEQWKKGLMQRMFI